MCRRACRHLLLPFLLALPIASVGPAAASWPVDPATNLPVCIATGDQGPPQGVSDGAGGVFLAWKDGRAGGQIFAQHVSVDGAPLWATDGQALAPPGATSDPVIVPDGAGGAVIAWIEDSGTARTLKAQRLSGSGAEQWAAGGVTLRARVDQPTDPNESRWYWDQATGASDGIGGMFFCFLERHDENNAFDPTFYSTELLMLHCDASGAVVNERVLDSDQYICNFCGDGYFHMEEFSQLTVAANPPAGVIAGYRARGIVNHFVQFLPPEIHAQDPLSGWAATLVTATRDVRHPRVATDSSGGAILSWEDTRGGRPRIYAGRVTAAGAMPWTSGGVPVSAGTGDQLSQEMTPTDQGGVVLAWLDLRNNSVPDVYAQRLDGLGTAQWANDVAVCTQPTAEVQTALARVDDGSVAIAWRDTRAGTGDIYGRFVSPLGDAGGTPDGDPVTNAAGDQDVPVVVGSGTQAIVAWRDHRSGTSADVYAQLIGRAGPVSGVREGGPAVTLSLAPVAPNPTAGPAIVSFTLSSASEAAVRIFDSAGRLVRVLGEGPLPAGSHVARWDGRDDRGHPVRSGLYLVVLEAQGRRLTRRLATVR